MNSEVPLWCLSFLVRKYLNTFARLIVIFCEANAETKYPIKWTAPVWRDFPLRRPI